MILIVGTGAMALLFGGRLAASGEEIVFLGSWQEGIQAINQVGITLLEKDRKRVYPARATGDPASLPEIRQAIVLVKSWQTERAAGQLSSILDPQGSVLTLQNGLGNAVILSERLGELRVFQGVTTYGATLLGPGAVKPAGEGTITVEDRAGFTPLLDALQNCGLSIKAAPLIEDLIWRKLAINVAINPISALLGVKNGDLLQSPSALRIMGLAAAEAIAVARAQGVTLDIGDPGRLAAEVAAKTAENLSSMLQDIRRGAPTEIDSLCGAVAAIGEQHQVPTPVNALLTSLIKARVDLAGGKTDEDCQDPG